MTGRELYRWASLDDRRRRATRGGLGRLPPVAWALIAAAAAAAEAARRLATEDRAAALADLSQLWVAYVVAAHAVLVFAAPYRLFWRRDSGLLARLAIRGRALFSLALRRGARAALTAAIPPAAVVATAAAFGELAFSWRHLATLGVGQCAAMFLGPAAALAGGAVVASDRAQALLDSFGGEVRAPKVTWLGLLPGIAATLAVLEALALAPWAAGGTPPGGSGALLLAVSLAVPLAAVAWAWAVADRVVLAAVREVAALDQEILATIERSHASPLERLWGRVACAPAGRVLYAKDAALSRRRYPSPYFLVPLGVVALWIIAAAGPASYLSWSGLVLGLLAVYAVIMGRRLATPPVEHPRLLSTLALPPPAVRSAKRAAVLLRGAVVFGAGGAPVVAAAPEVVPAAVMVGALAAVSVGAGVVAASRGLADEPV